jgi:TetR/AcrR family transcriptional regulator, transcriptional repressor of aconitase
MSFERRQKLIITRVRELFAHKGLEGATTRELSKAAGVSEGLLFKHFPTKQALYQAMLDSIEKDLPDVVHKTLELSPSTSTLVSIVHKLAEMFLSEHPEEIDDVARMYLRSLAGDGEFAQVLLKKPYELLIPRLEESIKAAIASGDLIDSPVPPRLRAWFTDRLAFMLMAEHLPGKPVLDYDASRESLTRDLVWFLLRGIGLKEEVIRSHYPAGG